MHRRILQGAALSWLYACCALQLAAGLPRLTSSSHDASEAAQRSFSAALYPVLGLDLTSRLTTLPAALRLVVVALSAAAPLSAVLFMLAAPSGARSTLRGFACFGAALALPLLAAASSSSASAEPSWLAREVAHVWSMTLVALAPFAVGARVAAAAFGHGRLRGGLVLAALCSVLALIHGACVEQRLERSWNALDVLSTTLSHGPSAAAQLSAKATLVALLAVALLAIERRVQPSTLPLPSDSGVTHA